MVCSPVTASVNKNNNNSQSEIIKQIQKIKIPKEVHDQSKSLQITNQGMIDSLFNNSDVDKSDYIDKKELSSMFKKIGVVAYEKMVQAMLQIVDVNNNGYIEKKEFGQIVYILMNMGQSGPTERIMFLNADKDFSGSIDFKEFQYILRQIGKDQNDHIDLMLFEQLCKPGETQVFYDVFCYVMGKIFK